MWAVSCFPLAFLLLLHGCLCSFTHGGGSERHMCPCSCGSRRTALGVILRNDVLLLGDRVTHRLDCLAREAQGSSYLSFPSVWNTDRPYAWHFLCEVWELNSNPHTCKTNGVLRLQCPAARFLTPLSSTPASWCRQGPLSLRDFQCWPSLLPLALVSSLLILHFFLLV